MPNIIDTIDGNHFVFCTPRKDVLQLQREIKYSKNGRVSDGGVFWQSTLVQALARRKVNIREDKPLPNRGILFAFIFVADTDYNFSVHILLIYILFVS